MKCCFISNPHFLFFLFHVFFPEAGPPSPGTYTILCVSAEIKINVSSFHSTLFMNFAFAHKVFISFDQRLKAKHARKVLIGKSKISNFCGPACLKDSIWSQSCPLLRSLLLFSLRITIDLETKLLGGHSFPQADVMRIELD